MSAIGLCHHNNYQGYCPACLNKENSMMHGLRRLGMGADTCPEGFYRLKVFGVDTGQCLPSLSTAVEGAQSGALATVGTGVASSPATQAAATQAAGNALGNKIVSFYKNQPVLAWGSTAAVAALIVYGGMSFLKR